MKTFMLSLLLSLLIVPAASAVPVTLNWTAPATCTNGAAIGTDSCPAITQYKVYCASTAAGVPTATPTARGTALTCTWEVVTSQTIHCGVTASNSAGESAMSNIAVKTITVPVMPNTPNASFQ